MVRGKRFFVGLTALIVVVAASGGLPAAIAEAQSCTTIGRVPFVVRKAGMYCLARDLTLPGSTGSAIEIAADDVVIDLRGHRLDGSGGAGTQAIGILAFERKHLTIRNGIVSGFIHGILLQDLAEPPLSGAHVVEDIRAVDNTFKGIVVYGYGNLVRRNQVLRTGGSTFFGPNASVYAVDVFGPGARVLDNDVAGALEQGAGESVGIQFGVTADSLAINNRITDAGIGIRFFNTPSATATGKCRDNITMNVGTAFVGCVLVGNNN
jgi:hypothetical protein